MKTFQVLFSIFFVTFLTAASLTSTAHAADESWTETPQLFANEPTGYRELAAKKGFVFNVDYGGESARNFTGGQRSDWAYTDQWAFGANLDTQKMGLWHGGSLQITYTDRTGDNLGQKADIGNTELIQEVWGRGQTWHDTEFWYDQKLWGDRVSVKFGRMLVGSDFAAFSCDFQNLTFCGSQPGNMVGGYWLNWPTSVWATRVKVATNDVTYVQAGAYEVNPAFTADQWMHDYGRGIDNPGGATGVLVPVEVGWTPVFGALQGSYKFGVWYNTANAPDLEKDVNGNNAGTTGLGFGSHSGQYGGYINFEQQITGIKPKTGWSIFLNATQADRSTAAVDREISLGTQRWAPFHRKNDSIGMAVGMTDSNSRYAAYVHALNARAGSDTIVGDGNEYVGEVYYSYAPIASLFLRPNLQYIIDPGGATQNKNAFILGLKTGISL